MGNTSVLRTVSTVGSSPYHMQRLLEEIPSKISFKNVWVWIWIRLSIHIVQLRTINSYGNPGIIRNLFKINRYLFESLLFLLGSLRSFRRSGWQTLRCIEVAPVESRSACMRPTKL